MLMVFYPSAHATLEHVYEELFKGVLDKQSGNVGMCYTRSIHATESQAKQLFALENGDKKKDWVSAASGVQLVFWVLGANTSELLVLINNKVAESYKENKSAVYSSAEKKAVENVVRLITTEWKEKGNTLK